MKACRLLKLVRFPKAKGHGTFRCHRLYAASSMNGKSHRWNTRHAQE